MSKQPKIIHEWQIIQDNMVRNILARMGYRRMSDGDLCKVAKLGRNLWDNCKLLRYPAKLETIIKAGIAVGLRFDLALVPQEYRQLPSKAFTLWTL